MESIPKFLESAGNPEKVRYDHPLLEPILSNTHGCIVYQEQVIQIFQTLAGYTLGQADMVRRAMGKKHRDEIERERRFFIYGDPSRGIAGCVAKGIPEETAKKVYAEIDAFAEYAFNKAHAVSYAVVAYQTAYVKCHHIREYMAALLTSVQDNTEKVKTYINECRESGITLLPPDINHSTDRFTVEEAGIRFGLAAIKNIGRGFIQAVVGEREKNGSFTSLYDFCRRMTGSDMNKRAVENLIRTGAFDSTGARRAQLLRVYGKVMSSSAARQREMLEGQIDFFQMDTGRSGSGEEIQLPDIPEFPLRELMSMEKEATGLYLSGHPMDAYRDIVRRMQLPRIGTITEDFAQEGGPTRFADGQYLTLAGVITSSKTKTTRNNSLMAYVVVEDETGSIELLCFSKTLDLCGAYLRENQAVLVKGKLSVRDERSPQLMCDSAYPLETAEGGAQPEPPAKGSEKLVQGETLFLKFPSMDDPSFRHMKLVFSMFPGGTPVKMRMADTRKIFATRVLLHRALVEEARETLGEENVVIK